MLCTAPNQPWIIGLVGVSILIGTPLSLIWFGIVGRVAGLETSITDCCLKVLTTPSNRLTGIFTGLVERVLFTCLIGFGLGGVSASMLIWTTIKMQAHYSLFTAKDSADLRHVYHALLGTLGSLLIAACGGALWASGFTFG